MITVKFTCHSCGLKEIEVQIPARETEDVVKWVERAGQICGEQHCKMSPHCAENKIDLLIPTPPESEFIGQQVE